MNFAPSTAPVYAQPLLAPLLPHYICLLAFVGRHHVGLAIISTLIIFPLDDVEEF